MQDSGRFWLFAAAAAVVALCNGAPLYAAPEDESGAQAALGKVLAGLQAAMGELTALDESDRQLAASNRTQVETTAMLDRAEHKITDEVAPALDRRGQEWNLARQQAVDSGCPPEGGETTPDIAARCNPIAHALNIKHKQIEDDLQAMIREATTIRDTRQAVSQTTVANALKQKANNARRADLQAVKEQLYNESIAAALRLVQGKAAASQACKALESERAHCCLAVVWDGVNPKQCDVGLLFKVFEKAGLFSTNVVTPVQ